MSVKLKDRKDYEHEQRVQNMIDHVNKGGGIDIQKLLAEFENNNARLYKRDGY